MVQDVSRREAEIVDLIYAAIFGKAPWEDFLSGLNRNLPDGRSTLFYHDAAQGRGSFEICSGFTPEAIKLYNTHYSSINPWMAHAVRRPLGVGVVADQMVPKADLVRTRFYQDYMRPSGIESGVGVTLAKRGDRALLLSPMTSSANVSTNQAVADLLTRIAPHFKRALSSFDIHSPSQIMSEAENAFDALKVGVVTIRYDGTVVSASGMAHAIFKTRSCCRLGINNKLRLLEESAQVALDLMLSSFDAGPRSAAFVVDRYKVTLVKAQQSRSLAFFDGPTVLVLLEDLTSKTALDRDALKRAYKLSDAETKVLEAIADGETVEAIAGATGRSLNTIRSHLKSIFAKTGTNKQMALMRLAQDYRLA